MPVPNLHMDKHTTNDDTAAQPTSPFTMKMPPPSVFDLTGLRALVTGGGSGLGFSIARCLHACGAEVVLVGRNESKLLVAAEELGSRVHHCVFDVTHREAIPQFVTSMEKDIGPVDILVNNAGVHLKKPVLDHEDAEFSEVLDVHLHAAFSLRTCEISQHF